MKADRKKPEPPPFVPVTLTLESQHEVDALYAFLCSALSDGVELGGAYRALSPYANALMADYWRLMLQDYAKTQMEAWTVRPRTKPAF